MGWPAGNPQGKSRATSNRNRRAQAIAASGMMGSGMGRAAQLLFWPEVGKPGEAGRSGAGRP